MCWRLVGVEVLVSENNDEDVSSIAAAGFALLVFYDEANNFFCCFLLFFLLLSCSSVWEGTAGPKALSARAPTGPLEIGERLMRALFVLPFTYNRCHSSAAGVPPMRLISW